jgi:hypothetical protein
MLNVGHPQLIHYSLAYMHFCIFAIYIIIWLSPYVLSVRSQSPPKLASLAPPQKKIIRRHAPNLMWNRDSEKKI